MQKAKNLLFEQKGSVFWIWFNRPEVKNAFSLELAEELLAAIRWGMKEKSVAALVISGKGDAFSAGGDIRGMSQTKNLKGFFLKISKIVHTAVQEIRKGGKPVLAAIPGYVGGIAFGFVLATDIRIASNTAQFNAATIRLGLVANGSATYYLPRIVGLGRATQILFSGEIVSAERALEIGLVNELVSPEKLEEKTQEMAERLVTGPRRALGWLKKILNESLDSSLGHQLERERQAIAWSATTDDFKEGMMAFLEKRRSSFNQG